MDQVEIDGHVYIPAKVAARAHGYTSDYIGQLIRGAKLEGKKVGRAWYVAEDSLSAFLASLEKNDGASTAPPVEVPPAVVKEEEKITGPIIHKNPYVRLSVRPIPEKENAPEVDLEGIFSMRYLSDADPVLPSMHTKENGGLLEEKVPVRMIHNAPVAPVMHVTSSASVSVKSAPPVASISTALPTSSFFSKASLGRFKAVAVALGFLFVIGAASGSLLFKKTMTFDGTEVTAGALFAPVGFDL